MLKSQPIATATMVNGGFCCQTCGVRFPDRLSLRQHKSAEHKCTTARTATRASRRKNTRNCTKLQFTKVSLDIGLGSHVKGKQGEFSTLFTMMH
ncbi:hypothetical protein Ciccas_010321 [Cichlidogyrus casuarinus]|uniref:C2H2-type domain-containing protein n=1 Tax=Cichlidogyrus casuarinus TaxID=1844966 RepID=A0ABD2PUG2_9PLAT